MPYDLPSDEVCSRTIRMPDETDHVIDMEGWYWNSLDWINDNTDWSLEDYIKLAWTSARELISEGTAKYPDDLMAEFVLCFKFAIKERMMKIIAEEERRDAMKAAASR